jgi:UPF0176 protein
MMTMLLNAIPETEQTVVAAMYKFVELTDYQDMQGELRAVCEEAGTLGTILLAREGINGTISGSHDAIVQVMSFLWSDTRLCDLSPKYAVTERSTFHRMKVRLKKEIVTMGQPDVSPHKHVGTYVKPEDWNALIADSETVVIDTRNAYEVEVGSFDRAIDPATDSFREFPNWVEENMLAQPESERPKNVAMFCTGGIRCEKATAYMLDLGFENVFHLEGGILKYLETVPEEESLWHGECFVFDHRVAVGHGLRQGSHDLCHGCRMPITEADKDADTYIAGVSCPRCHDKISDAQRARFKARQQQVEIAKRLDIDHIGQKIKTAGKSQDD